MGKMALNGILVALFTCSAALFSACSTAPLHLAASNKVPAAEGTVKVGETANDNTSIALNVKHMAPPQRVITDATTYVVWLRPSAAVRSPSGTDTKLAQNLGALRVDNNLNGSLDGVTPFRDFEIFITAEQSPTVTTPTGEPLLWTSVKR